MEDYDFEDFRQLAEEVTTKLRRMNMMQSSMHWQFGQFDNPDWYEQFVIAMKDAEYGWMSSHC